ncbi:sensor histidine kinase [Dyadobacter jiangsuensis]
MAFWVFFILYHLLFFIPAFTERIKDKELVWVQVLYYGRYIPIFYAVQVLYRMVRKTFKAAALFAVLLLLTLMVEHGVTFLLYKYLQANIGLDHLPGNFPKLGELYLKPLPAKTGKDWLVFIYDLLEMQLLILPVGIKMVKYGVKQDIEEISRQKDQAQQELDNLRAQLAPHFIFNLLNSVHGEIRAISRVSANYIAQAAELIRFSLYETSRDLISLHSELYYIEQYVELESMRTSHRAEINFVKKGSLHSQHLVPPLMLISLVENAFKHSVHVTTERSFVDIASEVYEDKLNFQVSNSIPSGKPARKHAHKQQGGLGLANLKRTLQLHFPLTHRLHIEQTDTLFLINLQIPLPRKDRT